MLSVHPCWSESRRQAKVASLLTHKTRALPVQRLACAESSSCSQQCEPSAPSNREYMLSKVQLTGDVQAQNPYNEAAHQLAVAKANCLLSEPHHSRLSAWQNAQKAVVRGTSAPSGVTSASSFKQAEDLSPQVYFAYTILCLAVSSRLAWGRQFSGAQGQERSLRISLSQEH